MSWFRHCAFVIAALLFPATAAHAGLIAITDSRADLAGNDFIDLTPLGELGSPLEPFLIAATDRLLPSSTEITFSLLSAGGIRADFVISIFSDVQAGSLDAHRSFLQVVSPGSGFLDGEPFTGLSMITRGPRPNINVRITFEEAVYGVGTNVYLAGLQARSVSARGADDRTIAGAGVSSPVESPLSVRRFVGFVTDLPEIATLRLAAGGASFGDGSPFIQFNRIDLITVAPNTTAPFGPGLSGSGDGGTFPVPEPSSLLLFAAGVGLLGVARLWRVTPQGSGS